MRAVAGVVVMLGAAAAVVVPAAAAPVPPPRILALTLGRPVLPPSGGPSAIRLKVRGGETCWVTAPKAVSVVRAHRGCRAGAFVTVARLKASATAKPVKLAVTAWVEGAGGRRAKRTAYLTEQGVGPLRVTTTYVPLLTVGSTYAAKLTASGGTGTYRWSVVSGLLPPGVTLSASGAIVGTPTSGGSYTSTVAVEDRSAPKPMRATVTMTLTVSSSSGGSLTLTSPSLPGATVGQAYLVSLGASGGTAPYTWSITGGSLPPGIALSSDGSLSGTPTASGTFTATAQATDSSPSPETASEPLTIVVSGGSLNVTTGSLTAAMVGVGYSATLSATGGAAPYTWAITAGGLPPGITLSPSGTLSGMPTAAGTFTATVQVTDSSSTPLTASAPLTIPVAPAALAVSSTVLPDAAVGSAYSATLSASGGAAPYSWSVTGGSLPVGLTLSTAGVIGGTPTTAGSASFTVGVTDSSPLQQSTSASLTLDVVAPLVVVPLASAALSAVTGTAYTIDLLSASGGTAPYTFQLASGSTLPTGLSLTSSGATATLSGTPGSGTAGSYAFVVVVTDDSSPAQSERVSFSLVVATPP